ncbi:MAG TPA: ribonuclease E/G [Rhizomicrobium sp.]|nr:ribonuclease E/G [Rhizomicrobium sp.]
MTKRMIIDASHREETRVVVLDGQKVEEFDFESAAKRPLKGNIYLAKVTRVEPSLQAAFVEYGGNRQGFLAFAEIHPDYYQIPIADRIALLAEQEAEARRRADEDVESVEITSAPAQESAAEAAALSLESDESEAPLDAFQEETVAAAGDIGGSEPGQDLEHESYSSDEESIAPNHADAFSTMEDEGAPESHTGETESDRQMKQRGARPQQRWTRKRHYKIQEVIKRRQVLLVQVVKEERGNKGAALTTYLSLAGRYCVLMPNTPRGGGISRKITSAADRNRLKSAAQSLELPEGMGLIIRTAGENRTKAEIKRDYEYLLRMWDTIRELTLKSNAPACVYEEGDLIKRAIRDLYNKDVSEILVEGEEGYRNAKEFMRMLMPSHAKNVKQFRESIPLFQRYQIEAQLDAMFMPTVTLKSGGYIVINQTEALVSIDVNSGKATREHSIEDTAYKTNLEAAEEIARQLRLRDLAGLIVIDFIDMEDTRNDRNVEKRLRDCVKSDRARVQIGKISQFGLLEMSRQRLRAGVVAGSTVACPHCGGQGIVRSVESTALRLLRGLEEEAQRQRAATLKVRTPTQVAIYALNQKRREIAHVENEYGMTIQFEPNDAIMAGTFEIDRIGSRPLEDRRKPAAAEISGPVHARAPEEADEAAEAISEESAPASEPQAASGSQNGSKRRRRRRRGRDRERTPAMESSTSPQSVAEAASAHERKPQEQNVPGIGTTPSAESATASEIQAGGEAAAPRKRRRRRRGRRGARENGSLPSAESEEHAGAEKFRPDVAATEERERDAVSHSPHLSVSGIIPNAPSEPVWSLAPEDHHRAGLTERPPAREPTTETLNEAATMTRESEAPAVAVLPSEPQKPGEPSEPARKGWWQRPFRGR